MPSPRARTTVRRLMIFVAVMDAIFSIPSCLLWMEDSTYLCQRILG
jgi:hypothetical protein